MVATVVQSSPVNACPFRVYGVSNIAAACSFWHQFGVPAGFLWSSWVSPRPPAPSTLHRLASDFLRKWASVCNSLAQAPRAGLVAPDCPLAVVLLLICKAVVASRGVSAHITLISCHPPLVAWPLVPLGSRGSWRGCTDWNAACCPPFVPCVIFWLAAPWCFVGALAQSMGRPYLTLAGPQTGAMGTPDWPGR